MRLLGLPERRPAHPVVVHQDAQPRLDALHDVLQEVLLHLCTCVECQVPHMNGTPHFRERHECREVLLVFRLLWCTKKTQIREEHLLCIHQGTVAVLRCPKSHYYLTLHVVEVVGATCGILEEGGVRVQITVQQTIKNLK